jgi:hypothetical protein
MAAKQRTHNPLQILPVPQPSLKFPFPDQVPPPGWQRNKLQMIAKRFALWLLLAVVKGECFPMRQGGQGGQGDQGE